MYKGLKFYYTSPKILLMMHALAMWTYTGDVWITISNMKFVHGAHLNKQFCCQWNWGNELEESMEWREA